jgi:predicted DNA binding CopG/RHH family protein
VKYNVSLIDNKCKDMKKKFDSFSEMLKQYSIRLNEIDVKKLQAIAEHKGIPYQTLLRMILKEYLNKLEGNE